MVTDNKIPDGYKRSEVGVIPRDWEVKTLGGIANIIMGQSPKSSFYNTQGDGLPLIQGNADITNRKTITRTFSSSIPKKGKTGDVIMSVRAPVGEIARAMFDCCLGRGVCGISYENDFLYHYLIYYEKSWVKLSKGSTFDSINSKEVNELQIPLPPLPEQTAIATALSDVDNLITSLNKIINKKRNIKQGTMQELLTGKKRLPGFKGEWEVKELREILLNGTLGGNYSNLEIESSFPLIKMGNIGRGQIDVSKLEYISSNIIPLQKDRLYYGDVLFNTRNTLELVGKVAIWRNELPVAYYNSNLMKLEFNDKIVSNFFINYILNTKYSISQLRGFATGTTSVAAIYTRDLLKFKLPLPPLPEQQAIAQILSDMDTEIQSLEQKRDKYTLLKQGMMQQLLTGKIRLI